MIEVKFALFVETLVELGYGEVDPELMLFYLVEKNDGKGLKKLLEKEGWKTKKYNLKLTDTELVERYDSLFSALWVKEKLEEVSAR